MTTNTLTLKLAILPTKLTSGKWIWLKHYWVKTERRERVIEDLLSSRSFVIERHTLIEYTEPHNESQDIKAQGNVIPWRKK